MNMLLFVALGGSAGAVARYLVATQIYRATGGTFPWGTLAVNVVGCAVLGALVETMALAWSPSEELRAFLTVGLLGALTTFSAFSLEVVLMMHRGEWLPAGAYVVLSVVLSVGALLLAMGVTRSLLA